MTARVVVLDYGSGNLRSAQRALARVGADVTVTWTASTDDVGVVGYQVHRGTSAGFTVSAATKIADVTTSSFTDAGRPLGTWYYRVRGVDFALPGNARAMSWSDPVSIRIAKPVFRVSGR